MSTRFVFLMMVIGPAVALLIGSAGAQVTEPDRFLIVELAVHPAKAAQHEQLIKEGIEIHRKNTVPIASSGWVDNAFNYYYSIPVSELADVQKVYENWNRTLDEMGEAKRQAYAETFDHFRDYVIRVLPEYSYIPESPRLEEKEQKFAIWDVMHLIPGKEKDAHEMLKRMLAMHKEKGTTERVICFTSELGLEQPVYRFVLFGKSHSDFYENNRKMWAALGDEGAQWWKEWIRTVVRKRELIEFTRREDLSYTPGAGQ